MFKISYDLIITLLGIYPRKVKTYIIINFIIILFVVTEMGKNSCLSTVNG